MQKITSLMVLGTAVAESSSEWEDSVDPETGQRMQKIQIQAPQMTEEDQHSTTLPDQYKCDACKAVTYSLNTVLDHKNSTVSGRRLTEYEYTELLEEACMNKDMFEKYSIGMRGGENVLSGPGLQGPDEADMGSGMGSIMFGGGQWGNRLMALCKTIVFDLMDETEVYKLYRKNKGLDDKTLCRKPHTSYCSSADKKAKKAKADKKAEKAKLKAEKKAKRDKEAKEKEEEESQVSLVNFIEGLALSHGKSKSVYSARRSEQDWKRLFAEISQKMLADGGHDEL